MSDPRARAVETRVLVLAPTGRDAELIESVLDKAGFAATRCGDFAALCGELAVGAGAVVLAEEVLRENEKAWADRREENQAHVRFQRAKVERALVPRHVSTPIDPPKSVRPALDYAIYGDRRPQVHHEEDHAGNSA